jgi:hypothetical protein
MAIRKNIGHAGAAFAAEAQRHFNELRGALHNARESLVGLRRMIGVVKIRQKRGRIPGSRSGPSPLESIGASSFGGFLAREISSGDLLDNFLGGNTGSNFTGNNFYRSSTQFAGKLLDSAMRGQRIR